MIKICIVTGTRAEYGLLLPLIKRLSANLEYDVRLAVTGSHLSPQYGSTYLQIEADGIAIDHKIDIILSSDTACAVSKAMGLALIGFGEYFQSLCPDLVVVLGDRYEILAVASSAVVMGIPVAHLYGGETTEGAKDEFFRHAITKLSTLHFTSCEAHHNRVIQMGESPDRVFNVGAIGLENIISLPILDRESLSDSIGFPLDKPFALVTFHPATMERANPGEHFSQLLEALDQIKDMRFIMTKANADQGGLLLNEMIDAYVARNPNRAIAFASLGQLRYLSALKHCSLVIGNSSSGIIEAPSFKVPTIDIGIRQKGRIAAESVIHCDADRDQILFAARKALSPAFQLLLHSVDNPYGDGHVSVRIACALKEWFGQADRPLGKSFYDLDCTERSHT